MEQDGKRTVVIPGTIGDLAKYLGVNRCALSRVMSKLQVENRINVQGNAITVLH